MAKREMARYEPRRKIDLSLPVEGVEQGGPDRLLIGRKVVERIVAVARDSGRRHIQIPRKGERHGGVQDAARRWLATEALLTTRLGGDVRTAHDLTDAIRSVSAQHRASKHLLFDFLEKDATRVQLSAFFRSDSTLNIRFFDLIVLALLGSEPSVRGELSQNFWDEAGKGDPQRSHVTLFRHLLQTVDIPHADDDHASLLGCQGLAGYNLFMMTGLNRSQGLKSLGVMAVTELLDPTQYEKLTRGCRRLGLGGEGEFEYYDEHVSIDVVHAEGWLSTSSCRSLRSSLRKWTTSMRARNGV
ncbi:iron-containing redox enzyme family protein [Paraburkholderia fynbosensis]|uniref:Iron-containing redox enzyme family protein n=1 Tax=Paraburkholderia fynbosensis TaxID=1200993 RepID=A0A6J5GQ69_9BURK|nr:iron-containing redox enzyme family protein [Paraburkholderia fynbosensis]CAB3802601.1 hypothetical protein LMG27177_05249 [Paraburkholderia fynbosensis]